MSRAKRFNLAERLSLTGSFLVLAVTVAIYVNDAFGPDIDGVNPVFYLLGLGSAITLALFPVVASIRRRG
ncbi:MAG: hypothetical protein ABI067_08580 [Leifsonia sp.]